MEDWDTNELMTKPVMSLASWAALSRIYRRDPNERKLFVLDEAQEVTQGSGAGRALVSKITTDSRKNNTAAFVITQNARNILGADIANFAWARTHRWSGVDVSDLPHLKRWRDAIRARPAVRRGLQQPPATVELRRDGEAKAAEFSEQARRMVVTGEAQSGDARGLGADL